MSDLDALYRSWHGEAMSKESWMAFLSGGNSEALNERIMHLVAERDAIRARIAELEEAARWIPVSERLPEKTTTDMGEEYLVMVGGSYNFVCPMNYDCEDKEWFTGGWSVTKTKWNRVITHWRELPQPPEAT